MISIRTDKLTKRFGSVVALSGIDLTIAPGELFFLLGPSGCGKTTLLRSLAGFVIPDEGRIFFGDEDVTRLVPHKRNTGMMFQSYALWPHMTVAENVAFGLEERRIPTEEVRRRTGEAMESVRMGAYGARRPNQLSGGQQQRVALARALVIRPKCLLLDEPLSNLDARLRLEMRSEIRRVCKEFGLTTVYVTHDQKEALSVADRLAVLSAGEVLQVGTPMEIYRRPALRSVADFIGETNFITGTLVSASEGRARVRTELGDFDGILSPTGQFKQGGAVTLSGRPEAWRISSQAGIVNSVPGRIRSSIYLGESAQHEFCAKGAELKVLEANPRLLASGSEMYAVIEPEDLVILAG